MRNYFSTTRNVKCIRNRAKEYQETSKKKIRIGRVDLHFGMDAEGEMYLLTKADGKMYTITGAAVKNK